MKPYRVRLTRTWSDQVGYRWYFHGFVRYHKVYVTKARPAKRVAR